MKAQVKDLRAGYAVKLGDTEGTLFQSNLDSKWYVLSSAYNLNGNKPPDSEWNELKEKYEYSFWIADSSCIETSYDMELLYDLDTIEPEKPKPTGYYFNPKKGDILHIMTREDLSKYAKEGALSGGGDYFGCHFEVKNVDPDKVQGEIYNKSGESICTEWWLLNRDFYEYHGITPFVYESPYLTVTSHPDGTYTKKLEMKSTLIADALKGSALNSVSVSTGTGRILVDPGVYAKEPASSSDGFLSPEKIKHPATACTLKPTSDWQISGEPVRRQKTLDNHLLILGL